MKISASVFHSFPSLHCFLCSLEQDIFTEQFSSHSSKAPLLQILSFPSRSVIPWVQMLQLLCSLGIKIREKWKTSKIVLVSRRRKNITYHVTFCCGFNEKYPHELIHLLSGSPDHEVFGRCRQSGKSASLGEDFEFLQPQSPSCFLSAVAFYVGMKCVEMKYPSIMDSISWEL